MSSLRQEFAEESHSGIVKRSAAPRFQVNFWRISNYQQRTAKLLAVSWPSIRAKSDGFRGRLVLLAVISLYLTASSAGARLFAVGNRRVELFEPDPGGGVGGGAPIAARRQGPARRDFRAVGQSRPLELAELEKAVEKDAQPLLDFAKIVGALCCIGNVGRPAAAVTITPGVPGEIGDLGGPEA